MDSNLGVWNFIMFPSYLRDVIMQKAGQQVHWYSLAKMVKTFSSVRQY